METDIQEGTPLKRHMIIALLAVFIMLLPTTILAVTVDWHDPFRPGEATFSRTEIVRSGDDGQLQLQRYPTFQILASAQALNKVFYHPSGSYALVLTDNGIYIYANSELTKVNNMTVPLNDFAWNHDGAWGLAVGDTGHVYKFVNGSNDVIQEYPLQGEVVPEDLLAVAINTADQGLAVGENGLVISYNGLRAPKAIEINNERDALAIAELANIVFEAIKKYSARSKWSNVLFDLPPPVDMTQEGALKIIRNGLKEYAHLWGEGWGVDFWRNFITSVALGIITIIPWEIENGINYLGLGDLEDSNFDAIQTMMAYLDAQLGFVDYVNSGIGHFPDLQDCIWTAADTCDIIGDGVLMQYKPNGRLYEQSMTLFDGTLDWHDPVTYEKTDLVGYYGIITIKDFPAYVNPKSNELESLFDYQIIEDTYTEDLLVLASHGTIIKNAMTQGYLGTTYIQGYQPREFTIRMNRNNLYWTPKNAELVDKHYYPTVKVNAVSAMATTASGEVMLVSQTPHNAIMKGYMNEYYLDEDIDLDDHEFYSVCWIPGTNQALLLGVNVSTGVDDLILYTPLNFYTSGFFTYIHELEESEYADSESALGTIGLAMNSTQPTGTIIGAELSPDGFANASLDAMYADLYATYGDDLWGQDFRTPSARITMSGNGNATPTVHDFQLTYSQVYESQIEFIAPPSGKTTNDMIRFEAEQQFGTGDFSNDTFVWVFGDPYNDTYNTQTYVGQNWAEHQYERPGTYEVTVNYTGVYGSDDYTQTVKIANTPPTLYLTEGVSTDRLVQIGTNPGDTVTLHHDRCYDEAREGYTDTLVQIEYAWGDGASTISTDIAETITHIYTTAGTKTLTVTLTDGIPYGETTGYQATSESYTVQVSTDVLPPVPKLAQKRYEVQFNHSIVFDATGSDDDADDVTHNAITDYNFYLYKIVNGQPETDYIFNQSGGLTAWSWTPRTVDVGRYQLKLSVEDVDGTSGYALATVLVTAYPSTGDWDITGTVDWSGFSWLTTQDITIKTGAHVTLRNCDITFNAGPALTPKLTVESGAYLALLDCVIDTPAYGVTPPGGTGGPGSGSVYHGYYLFRSLGTLVIRRSAIAYTGYNVRPEANGITGAAGTVTVTDSIVSSGDGNGITILGNTTAEITGTRIFGHLNDAGAYFWVGRAPVQQGVGILLKGTGTTVISDCRDTNLQIGDYGGLAGIRYNVVGIVLVNVPHADVLNNQVDYNLWTGLWSAYSTALVRDNQLMQNNWVGVIEGTTSALDMESNEIVGRGELYGIYSKDANTYRNTTIEYVEYGIYARDVALTGIGTTLTNVQEPAYCYDRGTVLLKNYVNFEISLDGEPIPDVRVMFYTGSALVSDTVTDDNGQITGILLPYALFTNSTTLYYNNSLVIVSQFSNRTIDIDASKNNQWIYIALKTSSGPGGGGGGGSFTDTTDSWFGNLTTIGWIIIVAILFGGIALLYWCLQEGYSKYAVLVLVGMVALIAGVMLYYNGMSWYWYAVPLVPVLIAGWYWFRSEDTKVLGKDFSNEWFGVK
jgi:hypothetical protein